MSTPVSSRTHRWRSLASRSLRERRFRGAAAVASIFVVAAAAAGQVRAVSWNVARMLGDPVAVERVLALLAEDDRPGFAVAPHLLILQEVTTAARDSLLQIVPAAAPPGVVYQLATYTTTPTENSSGGAQALFYRADLFEEIPGGHRDLATGAGRQSDRWQLRLLGYPPHIGELWVYSSHLRASNNATSREERLAGCLVLLGDVATLPPGSRALLAGDFNFYTPLEEGYAALAGRRGGGLIDPLGNASWSGPANAIKHTQSPREISAGGLVGGGLDDRFDFQFLSASMVDGVGLDLIPGSLRAVGNDGLHFGASINSGGNAYFPGEPARSLELADALFDASDHLPVAADYFVPGRLSAAIDAPSGRVIAGAAVPVGVIVANSAPTADPAGTRPIPVEISVTAGGSGGAFVEAPPLPAFASVAVLPNTATPGAAELEVRVAAIAPQVVNPLFTLQAELLVVAPAQPSLRSDAVVDEAILLIEVPASGSPIEVPVAIHNVGAGPLRSLLEVDSAIVSPGPVSFGPLPSPIGATPGVLPLRVDPAHLSGDAWMGVLEIEVSDENLPGETSGALYLQLQVSRSAAGPSADLNGDGRVDGADLGILLSQWGQSGPADLDGNGVVDGGDLGILLSQWSP